MQTTLLKRGIVVAVIVLFIGVSVIPSTSIEVKDSYNLASYDSFSEDGETEYWALIVGVGIYAGHPEENISSNISAEAMYTSLLSSDNWQEDHIKLITCENATKTNIIKGLRWLDKMEDENDVLLVYIATHGGPLRFFGIPLDLPPFDESDHCDEVLATYHSFSNPLTYLRDDELRFLINRLESQGICVIIDCCYAGGFNDTSSRISIRSNIDECTYVYDDFSSSNFIKGFSEEISKNGRVILMSSHEDELSWGSSEGHDFTCELIKSIGGGFGDFNNNDYISAEEAFKYTQPRIGDDGWGQHPTMYDGYEGDLDITVARYELSFVDNCESVGGWKTIDHTGGIGGDLWHLSEINCVSPTHCWYLGDENTIRYNDNMNNSILSPEIKLGEKPWLVFTINATFEYYHDSFFLDITTDNWSTYFTTYLRHGWYWRVSDISLYSPPFGDLSGETIQIRFRVVSDESIPFDSWECEGFFMVDDIFVYNERAGD